MRIAIDLRPLLDPFESGVSMYTKAMVGEFLKMKGVEVDLFYQAAKRSDRIHKIFPRVRQIPISNSRFHFRCLFGFPSLPKGYFAEKPDLIWIPDRRPFFKTKIPVIMTIHDMVPEKCAVTLSRKSFVFWRVLFSLRSLLKQCNGVLVPSSTVAVSLPRKLPKEVTFEGATLATVAEKPDFARSILKRPFFLSISPADPRKRLSWVFKMADRFPKVHFVIVGLKNGDNRFARLHLKKRKNVFVFQQVTEGEKLWFLKHARALLALSRYEGFDLPVLEAVRAKCPVIMSGITVHYELYKSSESMVANLDDLRLAIHRALVCKGKAPSPRGDYSWEGAANRALLLFRRVLGNKH